VDRAENFTLKAWGDI